MDHLTPGPAAILLRRLIRVLAAAPVRSGIDSSPAIDGKRKNCFAQRAGAACRPPTPDSVWRNSVNHQVVIGGRLHERCCELARLFHVLGPGPELLVVPVDPGIAGQQIFTRRCATVCLSEVVSFDEVVDQPIDLVWMRWDIW